MEYLFPIPSSYEIVDQSFLNLSFNVSNSLDKLIKIKEKQILNMITKQEFCHLILCFFIIFFLIILKIDYKYNFHCYSYFLNHISD